MIIQRHHPHPTFSCCPECGGTEWRPRKVASGRVVYDCPTCETILRDEGWCPSEEQIWSMAADLRAHRGLTWGNEE